MGRSGSPSRNSTTTSCPTRGQKCAPQDPPAHGWATRTQQALVSLFFPLRSQWNWTRTRPNLSSQLTDPAFTATVAVWGPPTKGLGVVRRGRMVAFAETHLKVFE